MANIAESYTSWFKSEDDQDKMWRAGRSPSENKMLGLLSDVVFGRVYDGPIKLAIKSSRTAAETLQAPGLVEYLQEMEAKRALEKGLADTKQGGLRCHPCLGIQLCGGRHCFPPPGEGQRHATQYREGQRCT